MDIAISIDGIEKLDALVQSLGPSNRSRLNAVAAKNLEVHVREHVGRIASTRHGTAAALGARPTGHIVKGMRGIVGTSDANGGSVVIPIPGIIRAWGDIDLSTPTKSGRRFLTIPKHAAAYGQTVKSMRLRGWKIFRPGSKKVLLGYRRRGDRPVVLFALASRVHQRKDPTLLPSREECSAVVARAMSDEINRRLAAARRVK